MSSIAFTSRRSLRRLAAQSGALACLLLAFGHASRAHAQMGAGEMGRAANPGNIGQNYREQLNLTVGEQKVLDADGVRSFSEGVKGIIDIRLTKDNERFVVVGLRPGNTTLLFIMMDGSQIHYEVTVSDPNATKPPSKDTVESRDNIRLDLYFVQLSNSYSHSIGVGWPTSLTGNAAINMTLDLQSGVLSGATATIAGSVLPRLDFAQADGWAKLTRKAAVITANGTQATFSGGGEVNIAVNGGFGGTIKSISYGSQIGVRPRYDKDTGRIELDLTADVSDLASDNGTGVPGRIVSTLQTVVNLELGQSVMLAGLTSASDTVSRTGLPGLSEIPILGVLFGRNTQEKAQTQNVIFIVPTVMDVVSMQQRAMIEEALQSYDDFSGSLSPHRQLMLERTRMK